jgi:ABC-type transporter Mla MlaB component
MTSVIQSLQVPVMIHPGTADTAALAALLYLQRHISRQPSVGALTLHQLMPMATSNGKAPYLFNVALSLETLTKNYNAEHCCAAVRRLPAAGQLPQHVT